MAASVEDLALRPYVGAGADRKYVTLRTEEASMSGTWVDQYGPA
jgi:hypothetical protein